MRIFDVNVLVYAFRADLEHHEHCAEYVNATRDGNEAYGVSELVLSGFVRIVTSKRILKQPDTTDDALAFCDTLLEADNARPLRPGAGHWAIFSDLCRQMEARDKLVADVYHAALAIENGADWVSTDRDFAKFKGLRWVNPLER